MLRKLVLFLRKSLLKIDDRSQLQIAIENGLVIGTDCHVMDGCIIDPGHCWLVSIGDRVTLAPRVHILAHDASTKRALGYTIIGRVSIGNDCFIGAGTIILPGVYIGNNVIVGAGSVVTKPIPDNSVVVGNPARVISSSEQFIAKHRAFLENSPRFDESYIISCISDEKKEEMKALLKGRHGYIV